MSKSPIRTRQYSTGGNNPINYYLTRDSNVIQVFNPQGGRTDHTFKTAADARRVMNNPASICPR